MTLHSPRDARAFLRRYICPKHGMSVAEEAVLLTSEAVANAVTHGAPPIILAVDCTGTVLEIRVRDGSPELPTPRDADELQENGRGLRLIDMLSDRWGIQPSSPGKEVWFQLKVA